MLTLQISAEHTELHRLHIPPGPSPSNRPVVRRTGPAVRTVRVWSEEAAVGGDGGQGSVMELTWRSSPGPCAQPGPPEGPRSRDLSSGEELTRALNACQPGEESTAEALLVPQKTEAGRFVPGTHGALAALSRLLQRAQRTVGDLDTPTEEDQDQT